MKLLMIIILFYNLPVLTSFLVKDYCARAPAGTACLTGCKLNLNNCKSIMRKYKPLTTREREEILRFHNERRNEVAQGLYEEYNLPQGADINVLNWDKECEFLAVCWVYQCTWAHDKNRLDRNGNKFGQNLATSTTSDPNLFDKGNALALKFSQEGWFDEHKFLKQDKYKNIVNSYKNLGDMIGHLTAMIWSKTKYIGCAVHYTYRKGFPNQTVDVFCNMKPAGNYFNMPIYKVGPPAGECEHDRNAIYPNLCGRLRPYSEDLFKPPDDVDIPIGHVKKSKLHSDAEHHHLHSNAYQSQPFIFILLVIIYSFL